MVLERVLGAASPSTCRVRATVVLTGLVPLAFEPYHPRMRFEDYITVTPGVRSGKPCIRGTRITVADVLEYLAGGMTEAEILADFPDLRTEHIRAVLAFAAARERRLAEPPAA